jgi:hypothetical protein
MRTTYRILAYLIALEVVVQAAAAWPTAPRSRGTAIPSPSSRV